VEKKNNLSHAYIDRQISCNTHPGSLPTQDFKLLILIFPYHILRHPPKVVDGYFVGLLWAVSDPPGGVFQEVKSNDARQQQRKNDGPNEFWMKNCENLNDSINGLAI